MWAYTTVHAEVYKWVDEQGQVHYGDKSQAQSGAKAVNVPTVEEAVAVPPVEDEAARRAQQKRVLDVLTKEREDKEKEKQAAKDAKKAAAAKCEKARRYLQKIRFAGYLYDKDKNGERVILSDAERQKELAKAEAAAKKRCKF